MMTRKSWPTVEFEKEPLALVENATIHVCTNGIRVTFADGTRKYFNGLAAHKAGKNVKIHVGGTLNIANGKNRQHIGVGECPGVLRITV